MADRSSAEIFSSFFSKLASDPTPQHLEWARDLWRWTDSYDFSPHQMCCNDALVTLGLARLEIDLEYPDDGPVWKYGPQGEDPSR